MRRRPLGLLLLSLTAALTTVPAQAACGRDAAFRAGRWFVSTPPLPARSTAHQALYGAAPSLRAVAIDPVNPGILYVTNGEHLLRSSDGGCSWAVVYRLPEAAGVTTPDGGVGQIASIDVSREGGRSRVLLAVEGVARPMLATFRTVIVRSDDGVRGWEPVTDPLTFTGAYSPRVGQWRPVVHSAGGVSYAAIPSPSGTVTYVRSGDGGKTWVNRTLPDEQAPASMVGFAVNPYDPDELWEWGGSATAEQEELTGLRRSTDGGATWLPLNPWPMYSADAAPGWVSAHVSWPRRGAPARVYVVGDKPAEDGYTPLASWSGDGGRSFRLSIPPLGLARLYGSHVAPLPNGDTVVVDEHRKTWRVRQRGTSPRRPDWVQLQRAPVYGGISTLGYDLARASASNPTVVVVPTVTTVQTLVVGR